MNWFHSIIILYISHIMGRRAKAFTLAEKKAQAGARQRERRQTTQYVHSLIIISI